MFVVMQEGADEALIDAVIERMVMKNFTVHRSTGVVHTVLGGIGPEDDFNPAEFEVMEGVKECRRVTSPYKLASRSFRPSGTVVRIGKVEIGGDRVTIMAGPFAIEGESQVEQTAELVARAGASILCGGVFRPGAMSPNPDEATLDLLRRAADRQGLLLMSEVTDHTQIPLVSGHADILMVGAHNMQNFRLLAELGKLRKPVLLQRGASATVEELLVSAEYILTGGNYDVMVCERGIRTFESSQRYILDVSSIPAVKKLSHLPILADPSQATGRRDKVAPMARAAVAAGADGLLVDVHADPGTAAGDSAQSLQADQFAELVGQLRTIAQALGRTV
ncbi:MAG: 3-deoxy-7-phosphoheptulonate synthase [Bryobacteraceae bacterium]